MFLEAPRFYCNENKIAVFCTVSFFNPHIGKQKKRAAVARATCTKRKPLFFAPSFLELFSKNSKKLEKIS